MDLKNQIIEAAQDISAFSFSTKPLGHIQPSSNPHTLQAALLSYAAAKNLCKEEDYSSFSAFLAYKENFKGAVSWGDENPITWAARLALLAMLDIPADENDEVVAMANEVLFTNDLLADLNAVGKHDFRGLCGALEALFICELSKLTPSEDGEPADGEPMESAPTGGTPIEAQPGEEVPEEED